jgi:hypothetical protein
VELGVMFRRGMLRLAPFFYRLVLVRPVGLDIRNRLLVSGLLMGMNLGGSLLGLFYVRFRNGMMLLNWLGRDLLVNRRRFRDWLIGRRQGFRMFGLNLDDRSFELVQLAAQHLLGRARLHALELPLNGTTSSIVNLDPHLGIVFRQAIHGPSNDCYKIRHQYFLMIPGKQPGRDSSLIRNSSPQRGRSQV